MKTSVNISLFFALLSLSLVALPAVGQLTTHPDGSPGQLKVPAGYDLFVTPPDGSSYFYLGSEGEGIPEGYFGCLETPNGCLLSDAIQSPVRVLFVGLATGDLGLEPGTLDNDPCKWVSDSDKFGVHCADGVGHFSSTTPSFPSEPEDTDTIVARLADVSFEEIGDSRTVPIEFVSLSLQSLKPITVTYGDGRYTERFQVIARGPGVGGETGSMVMTRTGATNGTYYSRLPVFVDIEFQNTRRNGPAPKEGIALDLVMVGAEVPWEVVDDAR
ncbi:MAG: hypothetical protein AAF481_06630 [Acidobacteriota bacterium]